MSAQINIACIIGTRPEVIKMAPIIAEFKKYSQFNVIIINTAQHRQLLDNMFSIFSLTPNIDLNIMQENQSLSALTGNLFLKLAPILEQKKIRAVIAQGDTTTTLVAALIAFYQKIPFGHVEAGLRSGDLYHPFPEELNRVFTAKLATWHFTPTQEEEVILQKEGIAKKNIFVTGNTVIDALQLLVKRNALLPFRLPEDKRIILVTLHRRESFGGPMHDIFTALLKIVDENPDVMLIYPVHPNPNVNGLAHEMLGNEPQILLLEPQPYDVFVTLMKRAYFIMTDSGGIQEEAPALGKPVLVLRDVTERKLAVKMGLAKLIGTKQFDVFTAANKLLHDKIFYESMIKNISPYGDGHAAEKIVEIINEEFMQNKMITQVNVKEYE